MSLPDPYDAGACLGILGVVFMNELSVNHIAIETK